MSERTEMWRQQVAEDPNNELSRFSLAQALFADRDWEGALSEYEAALALKDDWMMAVIQKGRCLINLGREDEAREALERGRQLAIAQNHQSPQEEIDELLEDLD